MLNNIDLKFAFKQLITSGLNRHHPSGAPNIAMFSSRRSGTTLVSQVFSRAPGIKAIDQPLSAYTASAAHRTHLPPFSGGYPYDLGPHDREILRDLFYGWHIGRLHYAEPWRLNSPEYKYRSSRLFFKFTSGHAIVDEVRSFIPVKTFAFFRHPVPHALSCLRLGWSARGGNFLQQDALLSQYFTSAQQSYIRSTDREGGEFERLLVNWFVENAPLLSATKTDSAALPTFTYEHLVMDPRRQLRDICAHTGVELTQDMIAATTRASRSSAGGRTGSTIGELLQQGQGERILTDWSRKLSDEHQFVAERVFDTLGNGLYSASDPMPQSR